MSLRIEFENDMQDWVTTLGRPTWNDEAGLYEEKEWQLAWVSYKRAKKAALSISGIVKANAPNGATHFAYEPDLSVIDYWRIVDGWVESWSDDDNGWLTYQHVKSHNDFMLSKLKPL